MRRWTLLALLALLAPATAQQMKAVEVSGNMHWPAWVGFEPEDAARMYVIEINRGVRLVDHGFLLPERFLDLSAILPTNGEGLSGMAFHPDFAQNGRFYLIYQDANSMSWISQWSVSADPNLADPASEVVLIGPYPQPDLTTHNFNCIQFGPDGMLWAATGDGGFPNDPMNLGQDLGSLHGKLLRLDVDAPAPHVPPDNPFVGVPGAREEIWSYGLREPWRVSFDRLTGDLWVGEVGQASWEEIDFQPAGGPGGENYGWRCLEGTHCTVNGGCDCLDTALVPPVYEYAHGPTACAVIGGYRYRGAALPGLQGRYVFADFCGPRVQSAAWDGTALSDLVDHTAEIQPCVGALTGATTTFGEDPDGELYFSTSGIGRIYKLVPADRTAVPYCWTSPNSAGDGARIDLSGSTSVAANDLELRISGGPPGQYALFYYGTQKTAMPFGNGFRCVGGTTFRLGPAGTINGGGDFSRAVDLTNPPEPGGEILAGQRHHFQCWYRDPAGGGAGFNLSDALAIDFCP